MPLHKLGAKRVLAAVAPPPAAKPKPEPPSEPEAPKVKTPQAVPVEARKYYVNYLRVCMVIEQLEKTVPDEYSLYVKDRDALVHSLHTMRDHLEHVCGLRRGK